jgi:hypothetical protein
MESFKPQRGEISIVKDDPLKEKAPELKMGDWKNFFPAQRRRRVEVSKLQVCEGS